MFSFPAASSQHCLLFVGLISKIEQGWSYFAFFMGGCWSFAIPMATMSAYFEGKILFRDTRFPSAYGSSQSVTLTVCHRSTHGHAVRPNRCGSSSR